MLTLALLALVACTKNPSEKPVDTGALVEDSVDADADGFSVDEGDCDDADAGAYPGAPEACDGRDQDCDGTIDDAVTTTWYADLDGDGFGDASAVYDTCEPPQGAVAVAGDCDDTNADVFPDAPEACNDLDDDCDGAVDEDGTTAWYADADGDGFGDDASMRGDCAADPGEVAVGGDCDDARGDSYPGAVEMCDELDNDCDGVVDDDVAVVAYADLDGDGWGDASMPQDACTLPTGYAWYPGDCDDLAAAVYPDAPETCNAVDDDCDGTVDEDDASDAPTWYADTDGDAFGDASVSARACAAPVGFLADATDCDDARADVSPAGTEVCGDVDENCDGVVDEDTAADALTWYADADRDAYGDASVPTQACTQPAGFVPDDTDCDDGMRVVNPAATERCNGYDDDCDATIDEPDAADAATWYADTDADGYGDLAGATRACTVPAGHVANATDCDDTRASVSPAGTEVCGGSDEDCDGTVDETSASDAATWYADTDADGFGNAGRSTRSCTLPAGYVADDSDCDDALVLVNPAGTELCNALDDDCDGTTDESDAADAARWYADTDRDSYGDAGSSTLACAAPSGFVADATDCDDALARAYPGALETCDGLDEDCDGTTDEPDSVDASTWYRDADTDTWGAAASTVRACYLPAGYVARASDCDDARAAVSPSATEACNGYDDDCDGAVDEGAAVGASTWYADDDADGYGPTAASVVTCTAPAGYVAAAADCNDASSAVNPGASERCNSIDDDCDGTSDESDAVDASTWYRDADSDSWGSASSTTRACTAPSGYVSRASDCNDGSAAISPDDTETCNSVDDDCDGATDESGSTGERTWYRDADGDGWGTSSTTTSRCSAPAGYVSTAGDCDDTRSTVYPGASETYDSRDNDCDGSTDEGFGARGESLACTGTGVIAYLPDGCINDGGGSSGGDGLEVYCVNNIARFCLTGEACPWRGAPTFDDGRTCSRSGLGSDYMANGWCSLWNGYGNYYCTSGGTVYFP